MKTIIGVIIATGLSVSAASAQQTTLKSALAATYVNNPQLAQARVNLGRLDENVAAAAAGLRPTLAGSYTFRGNVDTGADVVTDSISLRLSQKLWDNGQTAGAVDAAKLGILIAREQLIATEQDVLRAGIAAYLDMRAANARVDLDANNINVLEEQLRAANNRFEVGEITKTDVSLTESRLAAARSSYAASRATLLTSTANFVAVVGRKPTDLAQPPQLPNIPSTLDKALALALENNPTIKVAQLNLQSAELDYALKLKNKSPSLSASLSVSSARNGSGLGNGFSGSSEGLNIGLDLSVPIYQGGLLASKRRQANAQKQVQQEALEFAKTSIKSQLQSAYARHQSAKASKAAVKERIRAAKIAYDGISQEAQLGARTTLDVLNAEQDLLSARAELVNAIREEQITAYDVLLQMGRLTAADLKLPVELFKPDVNYQDVNADNPLGEKRMNMYEKLKARR